MSRTGIHGGNQIRQNTVDRSRLKQDFLESADWNITNGSNDATITGVKDGVNANDVVNKQQLDALESSLQAQFGSGLDYKGALDATGGAAAFEAAAHSKGDFYKISVAGAVEGISVSVGDMVIVNKDVAAGALVAADIDVIDNSESADILRDADVVDNVTTADASRVLSANQGVVLKGLIDGLSSQMWIEEEGVDLAVTAGSAVLPALGHTPIAGSEKIFLNGLRMKAGAGNDYTIAGQVVTFEYPLLSGDVVLADYRRAL